MAFFDNLGKKLSQTSHDVVQKTKDTTEIIKYNNMISETEKKIDSSYKQLGEAYFMAHADSCDEAFSGYVKAIREYQGSILEYKDRINKIKGVLSCPGCGAAISTDALFCSECGMKIEKPEVAEVMVTEEHATGENCPKCGSAISEDCLFCINCGTKVKE